MANPCEFCNESEGHADECPYPRTLFGASERFSRALRDLGRAILRALHIDGEPHAG